MPFATHSYDGGFVCIAGRSVPLCTPLHIDNVYFESWSIHMLWNTITLCL